jgi:predicted kinase
MAETLGRPFLFVEASCDEATLRGRLKLRAQGPSVSDADERVLARLRGDFEPPAELAAAERAVVDTAHPLEPQVSALAQRIGRRE